MLLFWYKLKTQRDMISILLYSFKKRFKNCYLTKFYCQFYNPEYNASIWQQLFCMQFLSRAEPGVSFRITEASRSACSTEHYLITLNFGMQL